MIGGHSDRASVLLARALRDAFPRARFRRHQPLGPYVAELASRSAMLVIEVGGQRDRDPRDAGRTRFLNGQGYRLIRFCAEDVLDDLAAVVDAIACAMPPALNAGCGPQCRITPAARRAEWSPRPDVPVRRRAPAELPL